MNRITDGLNEALATASAIAALRAEAKAWSMSPERRILYAEVADRLELLEERYRIQFKATSDAIEITEAVEKQLEEARRALGRIGAISSLRAKVSQGSLFDDLMEIRLLAASTLGEGGVEGSNGSANAILGPTPKSADTEVEPSAASDPSTGGGA